MEFADELEKDVSVASVAVSTVSESSFRTGKQISKVADNGSAFSKRDSAISEIYKASTAPPPADSQIPRNPRVLVWIRRDLFIVRHFCAADCFPAREGERLPFPKLFKFSRDWWSWREGGREICKQILMMAPGARGGYKKQGGRGGQAVGGNKPPQKPQPSQGSAGPSLSGSESGQNQGMNPQPQVNQGGLGEFSGFPQMWGNPNF
jgi:hypothetical protein